MAIFSAPLSQLHRISAALKAVFLLGLLCLAAYPAWAQAAATSWQENPQGKVRLVANSLTTGQGQGLTLGLQFVLEPSWHIYWRNAGDAGYGPKLKFDGSVNLQNADMRWPAPVRFSFGGIETIGYHDQVTFPIAVTLADVNAPLTVNLALDYLTCADICIPYQYNLRLELPAGPPIASAEAELIRYFQDQVPTVDASKSNLAIGDVWRYGTKQQASLRVSGFSAHPWQKPELLLESALPIGIGRPSVRIDPTNPNRAEFTVKLDLTGPEQFAELLQTPLTLTLLNGGQGLTQTKTPIADPGQIQWAALLGILGLALLGGLILNVMPCVLPVLSIKLLQIIGKQDLDRAWVRRGFLASAAGIVFSFWLLALFVFALKQTGMQLGWGIQFQNPYFIGFLLVVVLAFAANVFGLFEIRLPGAVARIVPLGPSAKPHSVRHEFLLGMFATLLATPCSAPFLGTALGFAFAASNAEIFFIFTFIGIGLALPYLAVSVFPGSVRYLPKPGRWMGRVKQIMGVALIVTALWLGGILYSHIAPVIVTQTHSKNELFQWQEFAPEEIPAMLADGKMVFVDITADWCLTCKVNEKLVLESKTIQDLLRQPDVVLMRGDWTKADPTIGAYLKTKGRYGIPFNALYSAKNPGGDLLPELLTEGLVVDVFARAK